MRWPAQPPFNRLCNCCPMQTFRGYGRQMAKKGIPRFRICPVCDLNQRPKVWWPTADDMIDDDFDDGEEE